VLDRCSKYWRQASRASSARSTSTRLMEDLPASAVDVRAHSFEPGFETTRYRVRHTENSNPQRSRSSVVKRDFRHYVNLFVHFFAYHSDKHLSEFLPTRWRQKSTGIDEEKITPLSPYAQMKVVFGITLGYNALDRNLGISKSQGTTIRNHVQNSEFSLRFCF